jgi:hypothetical protein
MKPRWRSMLRSCNSYGLHGPPAPTASQLCHPQGTESKTRFLTSCCCSKGRKPKSNFERVEEKSLRLGYHCKHMSPSPSSVSATRGEPLPRPPRQGGPPNIAQSSWIPPVSGTPFHLPHPPTAGSPRPHCRPPRFQYNGMSLPPTLRRPLGPPGSQPWPFLYTEFSLEPKLHHVRVQDREMTEPHDSSPSLCPATVLDHPQARILHWAPPPCRDPLLRVQSRQSQARRGQA